MQEFLFPKASSQTAYHPVRSICHSGSPSLLFRAKYRKTAVFFKMQKGSVSGKCLSKAVHCMEKQSQSPLRYRILLFLQRNCLAFSQTMQDAALQDRWQDISHFQHLRRYRETQKCITQKHRRRLRSLRLRRSLLPIRKTDAESA